MLSICPFATLFSPSYFLLSFTFGTHGTNYPVFSSAILSGSIWSPVTYFFWVLTRWWVVRRDGCCSHFPSLIVSLFFYLINSFLLSAWKQTILSILFDTQISWAFNEELVLPRHACCTISRLRCSRQSLLLNSCLFRSGRIENSWRCAWVCPTQDTSHLILSCPAADFFAQLSFLATPFLDTVSGSDFKILRILKLRALPPSPNAGKG